jgi:hypothetical protein
VPARVWRVLWPKTLLAMSSAARAAPCARMRAER